VSTKLQVEAARAGVRQAEAVLALARANLNNHVLRAPFDGVVVRVPEGVGGMVGPGIPVFRLEKLDPLLLQATVGEHEAASIKVGDTVRFSNGGREYEGTVKTVVGSLEAVTRRVPVEVEVGNADGLLLAGSYIRARLVGATASR
jgi:multidrug efflux system membrane fusion protein